jgi:hypothetical protein
LVFTSALLTIETGLTPGVHDFTIEVTATKEGNTKVVNHLFKVDIKNVTDSDVGKIDCSD